MVDRAPRDSDTREHVSRKVTWTPPSLLPDPTPQPGWVFRWVRVGALGTSDATNVSRRLREGWIPVKAVDHPELMLLSVAESQLTNSHFKDTVEVGGLMLCKAPAEMVEARKEYHHNLAKSQLEAVDNNFMRESDPRMPLFRESTSRDSRSR